MSNKNENMSEGSKNPEKPEGLDAEKLLKAGMESHASDPSLNPDSSPMIEEDRVLLDIEMLAKDFPQLELLELLGKGGMGVVYLARQHHLDRMIALKVMNEKLSSSDDFVQRFGREAKALARLNHPNIVTIYDFGKAGGRCYMLMEYVEGANLRQLMREQKLTTEQTLTIVPQVCDALQYAHDKAVVHRDIKPENILIDVSSRVKIADFGLAKIATGEGDSGVTRTGTIVGTPQYMAPEQIESPCKVDHRADVYALGVVFYELLTGELPLGRFPNPSEKTPVSAHLDDVVMKALDKDPEKRFQQADEFKSSLGGQLQAPSPPPQAQPDSSIPDSKGPDTPPGSSVTPLGEIHPLAICSAIFQGIGTLAIILFLFLMFFQVAQPSTGVGRSQSSFGIFFLIIHLLLIAGFEIAAIVAGSTALLKIRNSHGRFNGISLALFGILFPVFMLLFIVTGFYLKKVALDIVVPILRETGSSLSPGSFHLLNIAAFTISLFLIIFLVQIVYRFVSNSHQKNNNLKLLMPLRIALALVAIFCIFGSFVMSLPKEIRIVNSPEPANTDAQSIQNQSNVTQVTPAWRTRKFPNTEGLIKHKGPTPSPRTPLDLLTEGLHFVTKDEFEKSDVIAIAEQPVPLSLGVDDQTVELVRTVGEQLKARMFEDGTVLYYYPDSENTREKVSASFKELTDVDITEDRLIYPPLFMNVIPNNQDELEWQPDLAITRFSVQKFANAYDRSEKFQVVIMKDINKAMALDAVRDLRDSNIVNIQLVSDKGKYSVVQGPYSTREDAETAEHALGQLAFLPVGVQPHLPPGELARNMFQVSVTNLGRDRANGTIQLFEDHTGVWNSHNFISQFSQGSLPVARRQELTMNLPDEIASHDLIRLYLNDKDANELNNQLFLNMEHTKTLTDSWLNLSRIAQTIDFYPVQSTSPPYTVTFRVAPYSESQPRESEFEEAKSSLKYPEIIMDSVRGKPQDQLCIGAFPSKEIAKHWIEYLNETTSLHVGNEPERLTHWNQVPQSPYDSLEFYASGHYIVFNLEETPLSNTEEFQYVRSLKLRGVSHWPDAMGPFRNEADAIKILRHMNWDTHGKVRIEPTEYWIPLPGHNEAQWDNDNYPKTMETLLSIDPSKASIDNG